MNRSPNRGHGKLRGERNGRAKLQEFQVRLIRNSFKHFLAVNKRKAKAFRDMAWLFDVSPSCIRMVINGETWSHVK